MIGLADVPAMLLAALRYVVVALLAILFRPQAAGIVRLPAGVRLLGRRRPVRDTVLCYVHRHAGRLVVSGPPVSAGSHTFRLLSV